MSKGVFSLILYRCPLWAVKLMQKRRSLMIAKGRSQSQSLSIPNPVVNINRIRNARNIVCSYKIEIIAVLTSLILQLKLKVVYG